MTPEEQARQEIDRQLAAAGWLVQDRARMDIYAGPGVAIREFPLKGGEEADYLLYADGEAIGVVEAKPEGFSLLGVETQSAKYTRGLPDDLPAHRLPLPFSYESTGRITQFTNLLDPDPRSREVFSFHRPAELLRLVRAASQPRGSLRAMPPLETAGMWPAQVTAISNLERSLAANRPRSLLQMATGSGKTFTAVTSVYRLIRFGGARRVLFLVDRANLGRQAYREFQQYISPYNGYAFADEYNVQLLRGNAIDPVSRVCITTVQRLYSMLRGETEYDEDNEEGSLFETGVPLGREPVPVAYNPTIPIETFDVIVIDECHRSIYNLWRQALEYFDAFLIGLTATPSAQTIGFFGGNLVMEYGHEQAVADGVNVDFDVYRIRTRITEGGATLEGAPGVFVPRRDRQTRAKRLSALDDDLTYTANQLDRDVVSESQIRLVLRTFRDRLFSEIFLGRADVPKTLIFAKDDSHADDITRIAREEFDKGNDFCQKITYRTTGKKPEELLAEFRNSYHPRIAVTVDMIATGTDVKPLECVFFMRNVRSANYFEQMKGRGVRVVDENTLRSVTPDATAKTHFIIVDAVGVCEDERAESQPLDRQPSVSLKRVLEAVAMGNSRAETASTLAARLARLDRRLPQEGRRELAELAGGRDLGALCAELLSSIDPDVQRDRAVTMQGLPPDTEPTPEGLALTAKELVRAALRPFANARLRARILELQTASEQVIDEVSIDTLLYAGHDAQARQRAEGLAEGFRAFIEEHRDEIEALQVLYGRPYRAGLRFGQLKRLAEAIALPPLRTTPEEVWQAFEMVEGRAQRTAPGRGDASDADGGLRLVAEEGGEYRVAPAAEPSPHHPAASAGDGSRAGQTGSPAGGGRARASASRRIADLVTLVRHALDPAAPLLPFAAGVEERYQAWLSAQEAAGIAFTPEQRAWLDAIRDHIAASLRIESDDFDYAPFNERGGLGRVYRLFGDRLNAILDELNEKLVA